ncbi:MAG: hypothetical protein ABII18_09415 [bacterium]|nr:hypothetical protein [bacterium]MBU1918888.1 hypothetical protein [bacterium]
MIHYESSFCRHAALLGDDFNYTTHRIRMLDPGLGNHATVYFEREGEHYIYHCTSFSQNPLFGDWALDIKVPEGTPEYNKFLRGLEAYYDPQLSSEGFVTPPDEEVGSRWSDSVGVMWD